MERNEEGKKGSLVAVNGIGLSRRRQRITALRGLPAEEEGKMEKVRSRERERVQKGDRVRDRDQELMNLSKRSRTCRCLERSKQRDDEGDEESSGPSREQNYGEECEEPSSSMSNHGLRRTVTPIENVGSMSFSRVADEVIGVAVLRRARSASVKRLNEQWNSCPWGFGERQSRKRFLQSSLGGSVDIVSPSSSSLSLGRKRKTLRPKGLIYKVSRKSLPSVEDDVEIEVVEALFDLMKQLQSPCSKKDEKVRDDIYMENLDSTRNNDFHTKSVRSPTISGQIGAEAPDLPPEINSTSIPLPEGELSTENKLKLGKMSSDAPEIAEEDNLEKGKDSSEPAQESGGGDQVVVAKEKEYHAEDSLDSTMSKGSKGNLASEVGMPSPKREAKFGIDLMASPHMPSFPDQDDSKIKMLDLKFDLEKPEQENVSSCSYNHSEQRGGPSEQRGGPKEPNHCIVSDSERQNFGQSNPLPTPVVATAWPGCSPPRCLAPLRILIPTDESSRTTVLQIAPFTPSQPQPKRCVTHQYIACNIRKHQQLSRNCVLSPATGPATFHEAMPGSGMPTTSTSNSFLGNPVPGDLTGRHALLTPPVLSEKGKSSQVTNAADNMKSKQHVPLQTIEKAPTGNFLQPALIFPLGPHQVANVVAQQAGSNKSVAVMGKEDLSSNSGGEPVLGSLSLPAGGAAVSFNCADVSANDSSSFMAILQSNVHPYSNSTNSGMPLSIRGTQASVLPFRDASYYPSMFYAPQYQQKQHACQPQSKHPYQVQPSSSTTGPCSGSMSSYKSEAQQKIVAQASSHNSFGSEGMQLEKSQKQKQYVLGSYSSCKSVDIPGSDAQKVCNGQNYGVSFQTMNFALVSQGDGTQQQPGSENSMALIPSQAVGFSIESNALIRTAFNFSALPQETDFVQMLSDVGQLRY